MKKSTLFLAALLLASAARAAVRENDPHRLFLRGLLLERSGKPQDALKDYDRAASLDPKSTFIHETLASLAIRLGDMGRALTEAETVERLEPNESGSYVLLGRVRLARAEPEEALAAFNKALELNPANDEALLYAAHLHTARHPREAIALYRRFLENNPSSLEAQTRVAELQQRLGEWASAEATWRELLAKEPENLPARLALAQMYEVRKDTAAAIKELEAAREIDPQDLSILSRLGEMYFRYTEAEKAEALFTQAHTLAPDDPTTRFWLALLAEERKDWTEAAKHMEAVRRASKEPGVMIRLAFYEGQLGRPEKAVEVLKDLQKSDPANPDFMLYLATGYEDLARPRDAVLWLEKILKGHPNRADVHFRLAVNYDALKNFSKTEAHLRRAVEIDANNAVALNYLGYSWADRNKNLPEALKLIQRAVFLDPENSAYQDSLGWVYFRLGQFEDAAAALGPAAEGARDAVVWEHYAQALERVGKKQEALWAWRAAYRLDPKNKKLARRLDGNDAGALKWLEANARQTRTLAGFLGVKGRGFAKGFEGRGLFYFTQPGSLRFELLGPLFIPQAVVVRNAKGIHWMPAELAAGPSTDWMNVLGDFLSGELVKKFQSSDARRTAGRGAVRYAGPAGEIRVDGRLFITDFKGADGTRLRFSAYQELEGLWVPGRVDVNAGRVSLTLLLDVSTLKLNGAMDPDLFQAAGDVSHTAAQ